MMRKIIRTLITLLIFSLIGIMLQGETIEFMIASNLSTTRNISLVDLTINLFTSQLLSVYWILPLSFCVFYFKQLENNFDADNLSMRLTRYSSRYFFMFNQFLGLILSVFEYILYLLGSSLIAWIILGHRFTQHNLHFIIQLSPSKNLLSVFAIIFLYVVMGLFMVGLITQLLFLILNNGFLVFSALLGLCLTHTLSYTFDVSDSVTALLPFTQFSRGSSVLFYPFGLSVEWYTPLFQVSYMVIFILFLMFINLKLFKKYEV